MSKTTNHAPVGGYPGTALTFASITAFAILLALRVRRPTTG
jgi:hypothetical protein